MPKVSIILTSFNHDNYLRAAIDSALNQTFTDFELIIWDDASIDNSWVVINSYSDPRIKTFRNEVSRRAVYGINKSLSEVASGKYIAIHHSDDVWELDKLEKQVKFLEAHPEIGAVFTCAQTINENDIKTIEDWFIQENKTRWQWLNQLFNEQNNFCHPSILIRKHCYHDVGMYRYGLAQTADAEMWSRLLMNYPIHIIQEKLTKHRRFSDRSNTSGDRVDVAIRTKNEWNLTRENFLRLTDIEEIMAIFPSLERFRNPAGYNNKFLLAMACLYECKHRSAWQLGLNWLFELVNDANSYQELKHLYAFSYIDLIKLTAQFDVYTVEFDAKIAEKNNVIAEKNNVIAEKNNVIAAQFVQINDIYTSHSWRLTHPLRCVKKLMRDIKVTDLPDNLTKLIIIKIKKMLYTLYSFKNHENRKNFMVKLRKPLVSITPAAAPLAVTPYNSEVLNLGINHKILLVVHQFSLTGAPYAVLYLARALFSIYGIRPVVVSPVDGPIREEFEQEGFPTIVDTSLFSYNNYSSDACSFVANFERVVVTSLASFNFIRYFRGIAKCQTWWIHETEVGFNSVASMSTDLPMLFAVCESIWLGSALCFPFASKYTSQDKLHLLLYGCTDTALQHPPKKSGKVIFSIIGSIEPRKGQDIFLRAIELLPLELRKKAIFRIIGSPLPFEASKTFSKKIYASAKHISEIECIPNMPPKELGKYYSETNVIVSASRDDPMPIVITEGLMHSKICLCSSVIGQAKLIENEKSGLIFSNESAEDLSEKMAWIIRNPVQSESLGKAGRAKYEKYFQMPRFVNNVCKLLTEKK